MLVKNELFPILLQVLSGIWYDRLNLILYRKLFLYFIITYMAFKSAIKLSIYDVINVVKYCEKSTIYDFLPQILIKN